MKRTLLSMAFLCMLLSTVLGLTGCNKNSKSSDIFYEETAAVAEADYDLPDSAGGLNDQDMAAKNNEIAMEGTSVAPITAQTGRKLIRNIRLDLESTDFDNLMAAITDKVIQLDGYVENSSISGNSITSSANYRNAYMTIRIPSTQLDAFVSAVSEQGNVTNKSESITDVSLQYTDMESRKKSLLVEQERLWELLEKADSLDGVIALETRLSEIRYQLESYESQLRLYDNQVDYSTVELSLNEVKVFTPITPDSFVTRIQKGFMQNLNYLGDSIVNLIIFLAASSPVIVLITILVIIIWVVIRKIVKKRHQNSISPISGSKQVDGADNTPSDK